MECSVCVVDWIGEKEIWIYSKWETTSIWNWNCLWRMSASFSVKKEFVCDVLLMPLLISVPLIMSGVLFLMKYVTAHTLGTSDDLRWPSFCEASRGLHCVHWNSNIFIMYMWNWFLFRNVLTVVLSSAWAALFHFSDHLTHAGSWNDWRSVLFPCILSEVFTVPSVDLGHLGATSSHSLNCLTFTSVCCYRKTYEHMQQSRRSCEIEGVLRGCHLLAIALSVHIGWAHEWMYEHRVIILVQNYLRIVTYLITSLSYVER